MFDAPSGSVYIALVRHLVAGMPKGPGAKGKAAKQMRAFTSVPRDDVRAT